VTEVRWFFCAPRGVSGGSWSGDEGVSADTGVGVAWKSVIEPLLLRRLLAGVDALEDPPADDPGVESPSPR